MQRGCKGGVISGQIGHLGVFLPDLGTFGADRARKELHFDREGVNVFVRSGGDGAERIRNRSGGRRRRGPRRGRPWRGNQLRPESRRKPETESEGSAVPSLAEAATAVRSLDAAAGPGMPGRFDWWRHRAGEETGGRPSHMAAPNRKYPDRQRDEAPERVVCYPPGASFFLGGIERDALVPAGGDAPGRCPSRFTDPASADPRWERTARCARRT